MTALALPLDFRIAHNKAAARALERQIARGRPNEACVGPTRERKAKGDVKEVPIHEFHPNDRTGRTVTRAIVKDGLAELLARGGITPDQHAAGEHYRVAYEAVHAGGHSADVPRLASGSQAARTSITDHRADALARLKRLNRIVGVQCLALVQQVAGQGFSIRALRNGGRSRELATKRLRMGLGRIARVLGR